MDITRLPRIYDGQIWMEDDNHGLHQLVLPWEHITKL